MPIADLQEAAQKIAGFLNNLNKLGGLRLKYRITAGDGARDPEGIEARQIYVELGGPDVPMVTSTTANCCVPWRRLPPRCCVSISASTTWSASMPTTSRLSALRSCKWLPKPPLKKCSNRRSLRFSAHEQPRAPPAASGLPVSRGR